MKRLNYLPLIMAIATIISLTLTSCIKELKDSIDEEKLETQNLLAERNKGEITQVTATGLMIYERKREISLTPGLDTNKKEEIIREAYNKPGKLIKFNEKIELEYFAKSLWTNYRLSAQKTMMYYEKTTKQFVFQTEEPRIKNGIDLMPLLIFLALIGVSIFSLYTKSKLEILMPFWLCFFVFLLSMNYISKVEDCGLMLSIMMSAVMSICIFGIYGVIMGFFKLTGFKKLPMKTRHIGEANVIASYCFVASGVLIAYLKISSSYHFIVFLAIISPYLVFWISLILKSIKLRHLKKIKK